ncbi:MAG: hypothetical protein WCL39_00635 [Armatimonadota bacterium]
MSLKKLKEWLGMGEISDTKSDEPPPTLDAQLQKFDRLGIHLNPGIEPDELQMDWDQTDDTEPYVRLYRYLAGDIVQGGQSVPLTNQIWHFDRRGVEATEDYVRILQSLARLSGGDLPFENISDLIDPTARMAWVEFDLLGEHYKWDLAFQPHGVDDTLFSNIVDLTEQIGVKGRYTYFGDREGDCVIGYATTEDLTRLRKESGLDIVWMT